MVPNIILKFIFQAGPSFDLPDREKMRRYGWSNGNIQANGNCVLLETEHHPRGTLTSYLRRAQEDLSTDSCGENIRYQAVEGLVQTNNRHKNHFRSPPSSSTMTAPMTGSSSSAVKSKQLTSGRVTRLSFIFQAHHQYSSSMENLLSERSNEDVSTHHHGMVKYGSTGSISSIGYDDNGPMLISNGGQRSASCGTYTPSSLYSQDSTTVPTMYFGRMSSSESVLIYDAIPKKSAAGSLKKSNSRVSSNGKLRLRVESFRNNKSSSGTQTDISVMRSSQNDDSASGNDDNRYLLIKLRLTLSLIAGKYTGQYKKNTAPNKPARKHKPKSNSNDQNGGPNGNSNVSSENRSDRSASPDNSSTSGYSSPSAGLHSKESSPCGSKIPSPPHSLEQSEQKAERSADAARAAAEDNNQRITVIQIDAGSEEKAGDEEGETTSDETSSADLAMIGRPTLPAIESKTLPFTRQTRRELPRIATNGTLGRSPAGSASGISAAKRKLPEPAGPSPVTDHQQRLYQQQRLYRSNLPRPAPIHGSRVPLPPVPELERSDHERESMSPTPSSSGIASPRFRPLPSPLTTPIQPAIGRVQAKPRAGRSNNLSPSRIPSLANHPQVAQKGVEERLRILLSLLESGKEDAKNGREDTLQYLSQLESVARRLKDQLLNDNIPTEVPRVGNYF